MCKILHIYIIGDLPVWYEQRAVWRDVGRGLWCSQRVLDTQSVILLLVCFIAPPELFISRVDLLRCVTVTVKYSRSWTTLEITSPGFLRSVNFSSHFCSINYISIQKEDENEEDGVAASVSHVLFLFVMLLSQTVYAKEWSTELKSLKMFTNSWINPLVKSLVQMPGGIHYISVGKCY